MLKNELLSYVKMWGRRPCRLNISQQLCCRFFPVREFLVVKAEASENLKATIKPPPTDKDWYLYLKLDSMDSTGRQLCRLNISNLCKSSSRKPPRFETLFEISCHDDRVNDDRGWDGHCSDHHGWDCLWWDGCWNQTMCSKTPHVKEVGRHIIVGSKFYKVWGEFDTRVCNNGNFIDYESTGFRSNVESYDLTHDSTDEQGPSMSICQKHTIPSLIDPRIILGNKIMFNLEDKTYVLACQDGGHNFLEPPVFKVFDPCQQSWKDLPYPPCFKPRDHFTWDHKGFLIGMLRDCKELVAWKLDGDGFPQRHRVLHELGDIFSPFLIPEHCYLGHLDGEGRMWFVYSANVRTRNEGEPEGGYVRVAVFTVSISKDPVGNPVLSADLEAAEYYGFNNYYCEISSACVMCHHVKENFKPRKFCGVVVPNRPYSQRRRKGKY
ncbi:hypothetical protein ACE6H2_019207 [Prunus campanulata]